MTEAGQERVKAFDRYKKKYLLAFYDRSGEHFIEIFANVREILAYQNRPITRQNINQLNVCIFRAINWYDHRTNLLNGQPMTVWLVPDDEFDKSNTKGENEHETC